MLKNKKCITKIVYYLVLASFVIPILFLIYRIVATQHIDISDPEYRSRADYVLMLVECILGIIVIHVPTFLSRRFSFELPNSLYLMYIVFLYCAIFLGEVGSFYYLVPHWDVVLHAFSSLMAGSFGFMVVDILNENKRVTMHLSPLFVALFAFCFAVSIGSLWEIYEFTFDGLLGLNMQKFLLADGTQLAGHQALGDTMKDIIVDCLGALTASILGYVFLKRKQSRAKTEGLTAVYNVSEQVCQNAKNSCGNEQTESV